MPIYSCFFFSSVFDNDTNQAEWFYLQGRRKGKGKESLHREMFLWIFILLKSPRVWISFYEDLQLHCNSRKKESEVCVLYFICSATKWKVWITSREIQSERKSEFVCFLLLFFFSYLLFYAKNLCFTSHKFAFLFLPFIPTSFVYVDTIDIFNLGFFPFWIKKQGKLTKKRKLRRRKECNN